VTTTAGGERGGSAGRAARPLLIARGGATATAPEHTISAYEAAIRIGADALGLTVHLSADDQLVVIEDGRLERTTDGRGRVRDLTLRELKRLDAGRWFGRAFRGQRVQALGEAVERFRDRAGFAITLAAGSGVYPGIEERLVGLLQIYDVVERSLVLSLDHPALLRCHAVDPEVRTAAVVIARLVDPGGLAAAGAIRALCLRADLTGEAEVAACRAAGLDCHVFGVDDAATARRFAAMGVAAIVTDRPDLLRPALTADGAPTAGPASAKAHGPWSRPSA
jgi:glycerophosphoryl diester phosphodiesterase